MAEVSRGPVVRVLADARRRRTRPPVVPSRGFFPASTCAQTHHQGNGRIALVRRGIALKNFADVSVTFSDKVAALTSSIKTLWPAELGHAKAEDIFVYGPYRSFSEASGAIDAGLTGIGLNSTDTLGDVLVPGGGTGPTTIRQLTATVPAFFFVARCDVAGPSVAVVVVVG